MSAVEVIAEDSECRILSEMRILFVTESCVIQKLF